MALFCRRMLWVMMLTAAAILSFTVTAAHAQETVNFASVDGRVIDSTGAVISGARVTARQTETNITRSTTTELDGRFRFSYLQVGPYEITVQESGFADSIRRVTLTAGTAFDLPVTLNVASVEGNVSVNAEQEVIDTARTEVATSVSQSEIRDLPLNGRNFLDAALVVPGVSPANTASNQLFAETSAVPGQGISVSSQRNFSNSFVVDGLSANDDAAGVTGTYFGLDSLNEFQFITSGGQAEFGRALGGFMNLVTKSGTNDVHGNLYGYFRNQRLNAANALAQTALPVTQAQYGASLGGPIISNRSFYFGNFEQRELNQSGLITISPASVAAINARLAAVGYPGPAIFTGIYPNPIHMTTALGKVDHQFSAGDQFNIRYSLYDVSSINSRGAGGLSAASASANLQDTDQTIAAGNVATLSSHLVNETRAQFINSNLTAPPSDPVGPAVSISGVAAFGTLSGSPTGRSNKLYEIVDNLSYRAGAHAVRIGADFLYNDDTITFPRSFRGSYSFSSMANFLSGTYNTSGFTQTFANSVVAQSNPNIGVYAQDEWKAAAGFTLNLGIRYDLQFLKTIVTDTNNVSPRAGFAWTPFAARKTVVRGSYGIYYDRVPLRALANALLSANNTTNVAALSQISVSLSPTQAGAPVFPNVLSSLTLPPGVLFNFSTMDPNMQNAYSGQTSLEIEQQLGKESTLSAGYQHVRGMHLLVSHNLNVPSCTAAATNNGCRPNPNYGNNSQYSPIGDSRYYGMYISYVQRPARWGSYRVSYTLSKALDDEGEFFFSAPIDNYNIWQDYGRSDDDQRHRLTIDGTLHTSEGSATTGWEHLSHGFQLSGLLQYYSALPFNIVTGANTLQGTAARPLVNGSFISRNAGTGFDLFNINAKLSRSVQATEHVRVEASIEAFNLFNHVNGVALNGTFGTGTYPTNPLPAYRQITAVSDPRTLQLGLRFSY